MNKKPIVITKFFYSIAKVCLVFVVCSACLTSAPSEEITSDVTKIEKVEMVKGLNDNITLANTIEASKEGAIIQLESRTYNFSESIKINKPITIKGAKNTVLHFTELGQCGIIINSNNVVLSDLHIFSDADRYDFPTDKTFMHKEFELESKPKPLSNNGILAKRRKNIKVINCFFEDWVGNGIYLDGCEDVIIQNNEFYTPYHLNYTNDIHVKGFENRWCKNIVIEENRCLSNNRTAISVGNGGYVRDVWIHKNYVNGLERSNEADLLRRHGILVYYGASNDIDNININITNNEVSGTNSTGIYVGGGKQVIVTENIIKEVGLKDGVKISGGILISNGIANCSISHNQISFYKGSFPKRGAIAFKGYNTAPEGNIIIANNDIKNCSSGITFDNRVPSTVQVIGNKITNSTYHDFYVKINKLKSHPLKDFTLGIKNNDILRSNDSNSATCHFSLQEVGRIDIEDNTFEGKGNTYLSSNTDNIRIENNRISNYKSFYDKRSLNKTTFDTSSNTFKNVSIQSKGFDDH